MNTLEDMKMNLYNLNYPGINTMSDEAIAQVFGSSNRLNFLTWVYKQLETDSTLPTQPPAKCTALAEILYENGLCSSSEKLPFVKGDISLDPLQELQICQRIFILLQTLKSNQENAPISKPGMTLVDLDLFLNQDMNLFPEFGIMKTKSSSERKEAIRDYKREIQALQDEIKSLELTDGLNVSYDTSEKKYDGTILSDLENEAIKFKENKESLTGVRENDNNQFMLDGLELSSTKCNEVLGKLVQVLHCVSQQEVEEECLSSEEDVTEMQQSSGAIRDMLKAWETVTSYFEKHHPNKAVAMRSTDLFNDNAVSRLREILKRRRKQMTLNSFLVKNTNNNNNNNMFNHSVQKIVNKQR